MKNIDKVRCLFILNLTGWMLFALPTLPGEPRPSTFMWIGYGAFNLWSAAQCHVWLKKAR